MKKIFTLTVLVLLNIISANAQKDIEWDGVYELQLSDFQSASTRIGENGMNSMQLPIGFDYAYEMGAGEFMFKKNFNDKVNNNFDRKAASMIASDSVKANKMLAFARYAFDLSELYARKFRKQVFEEKGAFSDTKFMRSIYDKLREEFNERYTSAGDATDLGMDEERLKQLHEEVIQELKDYPDYCKSCKPVKNKK